MERWRIHKLKINGFKVFTEFEESYASDLVIYDGPNGFGKTSLFDAKQLLFCNKLPRVVARHDVLKIAAGKNFEKSLYQNHYSQQDISIVAELKKGDESLYVMRLAKKEDLNASKNKPNSFYDFKLYELTSLHADAESRLVSDEEKFWSERLGDKFLNNFSVLNYLQQDSKSIVIPDACDDRKRTDQISHLLNLDGLEARIDKISKLKKETKVQLKEADDESRTQIALLNELQQTLTVNDSKQIIYTKLTDLNITPQWDLELPFTVDNYKNIGDLLEQMNLLKRTYVGRGEIAKRIRNKQKVDFTKRDEFGLAVRLYHHFIRLPDLNKNKALLDQLEKVCITLSVEVPKLSSSHNTIISSYLSAQYADELTKLLQVKDKLQLEHGGVSKKQAEVMQLRGKLLQVCSSDEHDCPLCGFDYKESTLLIASIEAKTRQLKQQLDGIGQQINQCYQNIEAIISPLKVKYIPVLEKARNEYEGQLHAELMMHVHQEKRLSTIGQRLVSLDIELPKHYEHREEVQEEQVSNVKKSVLQSLEQEDEIISDQEINFFVSQFTELSELEKLSEELIEQKQNYIQQQHNFAINDSIIKRKKEVDFCARKVVLLNNLNKQLEKVVTQLKHAQTDYMNRTIGQMESLFHIYSGRLLQNYQSGLGVFIDTPDAKRKTSAMNFTTARDSQHDAILSMSSGQISALSLSLFLALNKKYAKTAFVFIDDPTQCMDEINIASFSDLLRVELRDRQVIISTHEQDISDYLCYRYGKAGLSRKQVNLLEKTKRVLVSSDNI
ncbi:AAA family ATPase [Shewanella sp. ULN5]|uniref:ATP-binding protein n=1 Tax=Shewanella sp. ULN5 TaxID=2994678 RepID=UPI0027402466|nr:AAA family ATPase [Shewanella sp. ULN5]MDP5146947.1 AAA family ATPase [Shewanella sp. ULN5]